VLQQVKCKDVVLVVVNCTCQNEDMAIISAQQYYVDYGLDLTVERLSSLLPSYLPDSYLETQKDASYWIQVQHWCEADMIIIWFNWLELSSRIMPGTPKEKLCR